MSRNIEIKTKGYYQSYVIKSNGEIELSFHIESQELENIIPLLQTGLGIYLCMRVSRGKVEKEVGKYKIYQFRTEETGETALTFRSDIQQVNIENLVSLNTLKNTLTIELSEE